MSNPVPSSVALGTMSGQISASPHNSNYSAVQVAVNALITAMGGGIANQFLQAVDSTHVQWAGGYTTYTPVWASTGTAVALGNGSITGRYLQIGKMVHGYVILAPGTTTTYGTGSYSFTLPVTAAASMTNVMVGTALGTDLLVAAYAGISRIITTTTLDVLTPASPASNWASGVPFTQGNGDSLSASFTYEAA